MVLLLVGSLGILGILGILGTAYGLNGGWLRVAKSSLRVVEWSRRAATSGSDFAMVLAVLICRFGRRTPLNYSPPSQRQ